MSEQEWEQHKQEIERLYIHEDRSLKEVVKYFSSEYSFNKSAQQYQRRLKKWCFTKNSSQDHLWISKRVDKRKRLYGKDSEVYTNGALMPPTKIARAKYGAGYVSTTEYHAPSPSTPNGVEVWTPVSSTEPTCLIGDLPWLRFTRLMQTRTEQGSPSGTSSLSLKRPPSTVALSRVQHRMFLQALGSYFGEKNLANLPETQLLPIAVKNLNILLPEEFAGQHESLMCPMSHALQRGERVLSVMLYLLSNDLSSSINWSSENWKMMKIQLKELIKHSGLRLGFSTSFSSSPSFEPTLQATAESLFAQALKMEDIELVELLLDFGIDANGIVKAETGELLRPLQYLAYHFFETENELTELLIRRGADVNGFVSNPGHTALYFAIKDDHSVMAHNLISHGATPTLACFTAICDLCSDEEHYVDLADRIIQSLPDINARSFSLLEDDRLSYSALATALIYYNLRIADLLLNAGAKLDCSLFAIPKFVIESLADEFSFFGNLLDSEDEDYWTTTLGFGIMSRQEAFSTDSLLRRLLEASIQINPSDEFPTGFISPLTCAVVSNDFESSKLVIEAGIRLQYAGPQNELLLGYAMEHADIKLCELLIQKGAPIEPGASHFVRNCPLMGAIQANSMPKFELLIKSGTMIHGWSTERRVSALRAALETGNMAMVNYFWSLGHLIIDPWMETIPNLYVADFLKQHGTLGTILSVSGSQILKTALKCAKDNLELFFHLLFEYTKAASDLDIAPEEISSTLSPLLPLAADKPFSVASALVHHGAVVTDEALATTWVRSREESQFRYLLSRFTGNAPTTFTAVISSPQGARLQSVGRKCRDPHSMYEQLHLLWQSGLRPRGRPVLDVPNLGRGKEVNSVLEAAVQAKDVKLLRLLAERECWSSQEVGCALILAIATDSSELIEVLMDLSPDLENEYTIVKFKVHERFTPLQLAMKRQNTSLVRILASLVDVNYLGKGEMRRAALQRAVEDGNLEIMDILLEHGAMVDGPIASDGGATPLQLAAIKGYFGIAQKLIEKGADVNHRPALTNGRTALQGAAEYGRIDILKMLFDNRAVVWGQDYDEAIMLAEVNGHYAAARLLRSFASTDN